MTITNPEIKLYSISQPSFADGWLMSDWAAGQTPIMNWEDQNVRKTATGDIELVLNAAPAGSTRPFNGGEVQSKEVATTGTWSWTAQAPKMVDGAVFGMFTYRADWKNQPWVEFDFEFVGKDTTKVQLNIHMEDANGRHISLDKAKGGPIIVDLGFDASQGMHTYDVTVSDKAATFRVDGKVVGHYTAADMPGGVWQIGPQKSYIDLWCASGLESWTGKWAYNGTPLVAKVQGADIRPGDLSGLATGAPAPTSPTTVAPAPVDGTDPGTDDQLTGTSGNDRLEGRGGNDTLSGLAGNDSLYGGSGNDVLRLDEGDDLLDGGTGIDWIDYTGTMQVKIDLALTTAQHTNFGNDIIIGIENVSGGSGNDVLKGNAGANILKGNGGNDQFWGQGGDDFIFGGTGNDTLSGGTGNDKLYGEDGDDRLSMDDGDDLLDGGAGNDWVMVNSSTAVTIDLSKTGAQNTGRGMDTFVGIENISGNAGADRLTGNAQANILIGQGGNDTLSGGAGADTLNGGAGKDVLYGGVDTSRDVFVFNQTTDSAVGSMRDVIHNFTRGTDVIDLRGIDAHTGMTGDQAFAFKSSAAAYSVWTVNSGSDSLVRGDVNGDGREDFEIQLVGVQGLTGSDFLL